MHQSPLMHRAFTLVEMLVVMVVAGLLMGMVIAALRGAQEDANVAKTRATIKKIDSIIQDQYEQYKSQSPDILFYTGPVTNPTFTTTRYPRAGAIFSTSSNDQLLHARIRLAAVRDLMRLEMPDCLGDLYSTGMTVKTSVALDSGYVLRSNSTSVIAQVQNAPRNAQIRSMISGRARVPGSTTLAFSSNPVDTTFVRENFNAELLFLIVESSYVGGSYGIEAFSNSEIGDVDQDGLREFIDAWGKPIQWLRWPAGYYDDVETSQSTSLRATMASGNYIPPVSRFNPDPMLTMIDGSAAVTDDLDPTKADLGYTSNNPALWPLPGLRPLIVSAGPDGLFALRFHWINRNSQPSGGNLTSIFFSVSNATLNGVAWPDPFYPRGSSANVIADVNQGLGGVLNCEVDSNGSTAPFQFTYIIDVPNGQYVSRETNVVSGSNSEKNQQLRRHASDNVANFDEVGGAL